MKRYGKLWGEICSMDNIELAHKKAKKGKRRYREVMTVDADTKYYLGRVRDMLRNKTFRNAPYEEIVRFDSGKERLIKKLPYFPDRIVQHCVANVLAPIWDRSFIRDTYAAIPGRGIHDGVRRMKKALSDVEGTRYCLKLDVQKYYESVNTGILSTIVRQKIKDPDVLWLLDEIIGSSEGIPIGNYLSQYFGNLYLSGVDHFAKEVLRCPYYFRYCDDVVVLGASKEILRQIKTSLEAELDSLKLRVKDSWQVFPVNSRGIDFLGYRFFHGYTLVRKRIVQRFKSKVRRGGKACLAAYNGWFKHANTHNLRMQYERI